jgi:hypothetical protein
MLSEWRVKVCTQVLTLREVWSRAPELAKGEELLVVTRQGRLSRLSIPLNQAQELPVERRSS